MRQICVYAHPTARMSSDIAAISQKLAPRAKKKARPSTYRRLVPQSPKSSPAAWRQPTFLGRSADKRESAAGLGRPVAGTVAVVIGVHVQRTPVPARGPARVQYRPFINAQRGS